MPLTQSYINAIEKINKVIFVLIAIFIGSLSLILFVQVFLRYVVHAPLTWSEEVAKCLSIWIVFLGMAIAMRRMSLIAVEAVVQNVPKNIGHAMRILVTILIMIFLCYLFYISAQVTADASDQNFASVDLSMSLAYAALPVGAFLTLLNVIVVFIELIKKNRQ
jgi:TRAP-type C4-dicarboxylate transport system permease small subunit